MTENQTEPKKEVTHNPLSQYRKGCRCEICRDHNAKRGQANRSLMKAKREAGLMPADLHGKLSGSVNWGCKCKLCSNARAEYYASKQVKYVDWIKLRPFLAKAVADSLHSHKDLVYEYFEIGLKAFRKQLDSEKPPEG